MNATIINGTSITGKYAVKKRLNIFDLKIIGIVPYLLCLIFIIHGIVLCVKTRIYSKRKKKVVIARMFARCRDAMLCVSTKIDASLSLAMTFTRQHI